MSSDFGGFEKNNLLFVCSAHTNIKKVFRFECLNSHILLNSNHYCHPYSNKCRVGRFTETLNM